MPRSAPSGDQLPLQQAVIDQRRLLTVPWVGFLQRILDLASSKLYIEGTHLDRVGDGTPDHPGTPPGQPGTKNGPGTWFYETDRTVLYQSRLVKDPALPPTDPPIPAWVYVLGTMQGTLFPDQRPTDLGWTVTNKTVDVGFQFEATDTGQNFVWDGTAWVDVSRYPYAVYGTHAERLAQPVDAIADGALWLETDRLNALYQLRAGLWWYVAGTMFGTLVPDQRPADLGTRDAGFDFRTSDPPQRQFIWSQVSWEEIAAGESNEFNLVLSSAGVILTTSLQDIPGAAITIPKSGRYWLQGIFDFSLAGTGDIGVTFAGILVINGVAASQGAAFVPQYVSGTGARATVAQQWYAALTAGDVVKLQASKTGGTGGSQTVAPNTNLSALWVSP